MFRFPRLLASAAVITAGALALAACAPAADTAGPEAPAPSEGAFPVTLANMYGEATIEAAPERIATWGWGATDAVLSLGIVPVAIPSDDYSGGDDRISPWVAEAIEELNGETPALLDNSSGELSVEELLATDPDVLIAPYSGLTEEEYTAVRDAGVPVVAPADQLWATPWRDVITETGAALGRTTEAQEVLDGLDAQIADAASAHPEFEGTTIAYVDDDVDTLYMYLPADSRVEILEELGFVTPESVNALDEGASTFYTTVSYENADQIDADVIFTQGEEQAAMDEFLTSDRGRLIPAVARGAVAAVVGAEDTAAITPTALTVPWSLPTIVEMLSEATAAAQG